MGKKLEVPSKRNNKSINVWLINTASTGGPFGKGNRIELAYTRALISAALNGALDEVNYKTEPVFGLSVPVRCPDVPNAMLYPRDTWPNENEYDVTANKLANLFIKKFDAYKDFANAEILEALPVPQ